MKVLIAGATGLIGRELVKQCLDAGIGVNYLTTSKDKVKTAANYHGFYWNPAKRELDTASIKGVSVIINLAGASVSNKWTDTYKKLILQSRLDTANVLYDCLKANEHSVQHYIAASGISAYPSSLSIDYVESHPTYADSFLGKVTAEWEGVADQFSKLNILVSKVRTGIVLDSNDGALPKIVQPIKMGVGAPLGSGEQFQSWIHIQDIAAIYIHLMTNKQEGVYNGVAPLPITNKEMTKQIAQQLKKPLWLPKVPKFMLSLLLGDMSALVLESQKVSAKKIIDHGYVFKFSVFEKAIKDLIK